MKRGLICAAVLLAANVMIGPAANTAIAQDKDMKFGGFGSAAAQQQRANPNSSGLGPLVGQANQNENAAKLKSEKPDDQEFGAFRFGGATVITPRDKGASEKD